MSELNENRWAVTSERGAEQTHLTYDEAMSVVAQLTAQRIRGLTVISDEAARRLSEDANKHSENSTGAAT